MTNYWKPYENIRRKKWLSLVLRNSVEPKILILKKVNGLIKNIHYSFENGFWNSWNVLFQRLPKNFGANSNLHIVPTWN
jgi:hypothetical protein